MLFINFITSNSFSDYSWRGNGRNYQRNFSLQNQENDLKFHFNIRKLKILGTILEILATFVFTKFQHIIDFGISISAFWINLKTFFFSKW